MYKYLALSIEPGTSDKKIYVKYRLLPQTFSKLQRLDKNSWIVKERIARHLHDVLDIPNDYSIVLMVRLKACPYYEIDYAWNKRLNNLLLKYLHLETNMWNLSTLGGAFSSMGDFFDDFANRAFQVSLKQRKIAIDLDDPILISRCSLYIALSLAQLHYFFEAKQLLKSEYQDAKKLKSTFLINCTIGTWVKIRQIYKHAQN